MGAGTLPTSGPVPSKIEAKRDAEILGGGKSHLGLGPSPVRKRLCRRAFSRRLGFDLDHAA
jgi:hypothetical protein